MPPLPKPPAEAFIEAVDAPGGVGLRMRAAPPAEAFAAKVPPEPERDAIGRVHARLTAEPPAGSNTGVSRAIFGEKMGSWDTPGRVVRATGELMLPRSWPGVAASAAAMLPGAGIPAAFARTLLGTGASAGIEAIRGGDPLKGATEGAAMTVGGEVLGGATRAGVRYAGATLEPYLRNVGEAIERIVPAFRGKTAEQTIQRAMSSEGQQALSREFGKSVDAVIARNGNPAIMIPSVSGVTGNSRDSFGTASEMLKRIQSLEREWRLASREPTRRREALVQLDRIRAAHDEYVAELQRLMPDEGNFLTAAEAAYAKGKEIQRWLGGGRERIGEGRAKQLVERGRDRAPSLNAPLLQESLSLRRGTLAGKLSADEMRALEQAVSRGERNPLARDIPGVTPQVRFWRPVPHVYGLPHVPRRIGEYPELRSEQAAEAARLLGTRAVESAE